MRPPIFKPILIIVALLLTVCGCTKNNPQDELPPATQTGANTFGCIYNGVVFTPKRYNGFTFISAPKIPISVPEYYTNTKHHSYRVTARRREKIKFLQYVYISITFKRSRRIQSWKCFV